MLNTDVGRGRADPESSQHRSTDIIDFLPDATFAIDSNGIVIAWNKAMEVLTGVVAKSMLGKGNYEHALPFYKERRPMLADFVFRPDDEIKKQYNNVERTGGILAADFFIPDFRPGGAFFWAKAGPLYDPEGNVTGAIESLRDITEWKRTERALMESEEKYHDLVENANSIILKWDKNGSITFFNEFAQRFFGFTSDEIMGKPVVGTIVPPTESGSERNLRAMIDDIIRHPGNHVLNENENITKDGRRVWIQWHNRILRDENGQFTGLLSVGTDITERRRAEEALRESGERYRTLFENSGNPLVVINEDYSIVQLNREYELLFGYRREDVEGRRWTEFIADPADIERLKEYHQLRRMNADAAPATYECRIVDRGGSIRNIIVNAAMIPGTHQSLIAVVDITARKRAEDELQALLTKTSEDMRYRYLTIFENSGTGMAVVEDDGTISLANSMLEQIIGWPRSEVEHHRSVFSFVVPEEQAEAERIHRSLREEGKGAFRLDESRIVRKDGSIRNIVISGKVFPGTRESIISILDITERKRMEEALRAAHKKISILSSITRHDIRNQMLALRGFLELSRMKEKDPEILQYFDKEEKAAEAISEQIEFSKAYEEIGVTAPEWQDIPELIRKAYTQLPLPETIRVVIEMPPVRVFADRLIEKVFYNLMENTLRHGGSVSMMRFSFAEPDGAIVYEDDGAGVSPEDKTRLFEKGFGKNTGLGLFLSREILAITGITIRECGEPGKGVRFEIIVPRDGYRFICPFTVPGRSSEE